MELGRKNILRINTYEAGRPIEEIKREMGLKKVIKLASNENPLGPSPKSVEAIRRGISSLNRYPDANAFYLKKKLAKYYCLEPGNFSVGNGSDELIETAIKAFVEDDENIVVSDLTFLEYKIIAGVLSRNIEVVPLKYFKYDLEAIRRKINRRTKLVFIANPNNPTGTYVTRQEVEEFLKSIPESVLVVFDEAYDAFIDVNDFPSTLSYIKKGNVLVFKTFSKSYGLAGLRIGVAIGSAGVISLLEKARQPFNVNLLAQLASAAALEDKEFLIKTRRQVLQGKKYIYDALKDMGLAYLPSVANFILVDLGRDGLVVFKEMLKYGVIVRDMRQYGLKNFIRVSIGTKKENERFVKVLRKVLKGKERL